MEIAELEKKVNILSLVDKNKLKKEGNVYRIEPCPVCGHSEHFTIYPETNSYFSFSGCCKGGGVYKYLQEVKGLSEEEAYTHLCELAGENKPAFHLKDMYQPKDYTAWINDLYSNLTERGRNYFIFRGIPDELIEKYKLCIADERAILPIWRNGKVISYTSRALVDGQEPKYKNAAGEAPLFNIENLKATGEPVVITEGIFDALSVEAEGYKAIALGGTQHWYKLLDAIEKTPNRAIILTAFDNDAAGKQVTRDVGYKAITIPAKYKDVNEWHIKEPGGLKAAIEEALITATDSVSGYLTKAFKADIEKYRAFMEKKTGFENLDIEMNGLYEGLYVIGGISSVGKTTFVHQLGDQLAERGEHVIYFSLEQSKLELVSKSLSRLTAKVDYGKAIPSISIRNGHITKEVTEAMNEYMDIAQRVSIIEGNYETTTESIRDYISRYINLNSVKPVVIVDYLQIIPGDMRKNDKQRIDGNVTELKRISRDFGLILFVVSSLNRGNYLVPIDFESFKESGGIEYTADVIWGLQLEVINNDIFSSDKKIKEKREMIRRAKAEEPRKIELISLKNRSGKSYFSCCFNYYAKYDLFEAK